MRGFLVSILPDPGMVIFLIIAGLIFYVLFRMVTDTRVPGFMDDPVERGATPPARPDPEAEARRGQF